MRADDRVEQRRLILRIEREAVALAHLQILVTDARATVACHRHELRIVTGRLKRRPL